MGCCVSTEPADDHKTVPSGDSVDGDTVVKEVLSETPKPQNDFARAKTTTDPPPSFPDDKPSPPPRSDDLHRQISQVLSEIRSIAGKSAGDDDDFYRASPSPSKLRQPVGQSPGRRISDQSPGRRNGSARAIQRESGPGMRSASANRSGRRSRSPAVRGEAGANNNAGRALPERRVNQSPRRVRTGSPESCGKESLENPLVSMECFIFL